MSRFSRRAILAAAAIVLAALLLPAAGVHAAAASCLDADGDGVCDEFDNCPSVYNPDQLDTDGDNDGDACDSDDDNDGDPDAIDNCPTIPNANQSDNDGDGLGNRCDPCRDDPGIDCSDCSCFNCNPCPGDWDCDGVEDAADSCACVYNTGQADADGDGTGDVCDACIDIDGDGAGFVMPGFPAESCAIDNCPDRSNPTQADNDGDGIGNACDDCAGGPGCVDPCPGEGSCQQDWDCGPNEFCHGVEKCFLPGPCSCEHGNWSCAQVCSGHCHALNVPGCEDPDGPDDDDDGVFGVCDNCPDVPNAGQFDSDDDGVGEVCDNCVNKANPAQGDADGDGLGDLCDGRPGVLLVGFDWADSILWGALEAYDSWNLYRGDLGLLKTTGDYTQQPGTSPAALRLCNLADPALDDLDEPASGGVSFYLISGNLDGAEWGLGVDGNGAQRPNTHPCSTPADELLCTSTGGCWDVISCGHYTCGNFPDCDAIVPGCDCGSESNFVDGAGCVIDNACP